MSPGAGRRARYAAVSHDVIAGDTALSHQEGHQAPQRSHLGGIGSLLLKIPDQADADTVLVEAVAGNFAMGARFLLGPARADFDRPVRRVRMSIIVSDILIILNLCMTVYFQKDLILYIKFLKNPLSEKKF